MIKCGSGDAGNSPTTDYICIALVTENMMRPILTMGVKRALVDISLLIS